MKYICFGYLDTKKWATLSDSEQNAAIDECFAYDDDVLRLAERQILRVLADHTHSSGRDVA